MNTENHYSETDLGNISIHLCGEYDPQRVYEYLDAVEFGGGSYICAIEYGKTITGIAPEPSKNTEYWHINSIPGTLTPEYIAMHDRVKNLSEQVEADAEEVRAAEQNVAGMELNVTQMQEQTRQAAEESEQSKDSAAGYASSAEASRQAAEESEQNVNAQVSGFDNHVAEKTEEAENDIEAARIAANKAIIAQQEQSANEVARAGIEAVSTSQSAAQTATEKAQAAATSEKNAAASEAATKLSEENATKMAEQVATDKEQVAYDRTAVEKAKQEMTESVAQIEQNTQGISELKGDIVYLDDRDNWFFGINFKWEIGGINPANGQDIENASRSRTVGMYRIPKGTTITSNINTYIIVYGATITYHGWLKEWTATEDCEIRIMLNTNDSTFYRQVSIDFHSDNMDRAEVEESIKKVGVADYTVHEFTDGTAAAPPNRWFLSDEIKPDTYIDSIEFKQIKMVKSVNMSVEVWEYTDDGLTIERVFKTLYPTIGGGQSNDNAKVSIKYSTKKKAIICVVTPVACVYMTSETGIKRDKRYTSGDVSEVSKLSVSALVNVGYRLNIKVNLSVTMPFIYDLATVERNSNIVVIGEYGDFKNIQTALDSIEDDTSVNPYVFKIMPGTYPCFSMTVKGRVRYISMIGECKHDCIIRDDSGQYYNAPALVYTNGMFKNLTFLATHDNPPALADRENAKHKSYALHMDCGTQDVLFEDCVFTSYQAPAVGIGCYQDVKYHFKNCEMYSYCPAYDETDPDYRTNWSWLANYGALFCHSNTNNNITNQRIILDNCRMYSKYGDKGLWITYAGEFVDSEMFATVIGNVAMNKDNIPSASIHSSITVTADSYGNNWN